MTYEEALHYIDGLKPLGMQFGLERVRRGLSLAGDPQQRLRVVHIAGTNGKGSTAAMIQSMLTAAGYRTGRYTSPALSDVRDTIAVDGQPISRETFAALAEEIASFDMGDVGPMTEFEFLTVLTLLWFARERTDVCVVECGLGGDTDATNVFDAPLVTVFTPISLDHTNLLGETVAEIARRKSGIMKPHAAVVSAPEQSDEALGVLMEEAARRGLTVRMRYAASAALTAEQPNRLEFVADDKAYTLSVNGAFQIRNALTAFEVVDALGEKGFPVSEEARRAGLSAVRLPCRQEWLPGSPPILLDGAHNPQGIHALAQTLPRLCGDRKPVLLTGMLRDKDVAAVTEELRPLVAAVFTCTPQNPRALSAEALAEFYRPLPVTVMQEPSAAFEAAWQAAADEHRPLVVGGSFYVSGAVREQALQKQQ